MGGKDAVVVEQQDLRGKRLQQDGQHVLRGVRVHVEGGGVGHDAQAGGLRTASGEGQGHRLGVAVLHQQGGDDAHPVGGAAAGGVEAGGGDLQAVAVKVFRVAGLVQGGLGHPLAVGAAAHEDAPLTVPHVGGKEFGGAGAVTVHQQDQGLSGELGGAAGIGRRLAVVVLKVEVAARTVHRRRHLQGGIHVAAAVVPQVHQPAVHLAVVFPEALGKELVGVQTEAAAVHIAHAVLQQGELGVGDVHGPAGEGVVPGLAAAQDGDGDLGALVAQHKLAVVACGGGAGDAVNGHDEVAGRQSGLLGGTAVKGLLEQETVLGIGDLHADAHQVHGVLHRVQEGGVLLLGHVLGVGVAQQRDELVQGLGLVGAIGDVIVKAVLQQLQRLVHRQGGGGSGQQDQGQQGGDEAGQIFFHVGSPFVRPMGFVN